jgi:hypothetical protein
MKNAHRILSENVKGRDHLGYLGVDGRMILKWILKNREFDDWIHLALDRVHWRTVVNTLMDIHIL